jgi:hypothetical protein
MVQVHQHALLVHARHEVTSNKLSPALRGSAAVAYQIFKL